MLVRAAIARATASLSPAAVMLAGLDWALHLAVSPGKRMALARLAWEQVDELLHLLRSGAPAPAPAPDRRFAAPAWQQWPFHLLQRSFLMQQQWWAAATRGVRGVDPHHEEMVAFIARQGLDMLSPGNQLLTNPVVLQRTADEAGGNLLRGWLHAVDDLRRLATGAPPAGTEQFRPGHEVACTPGRVVMRNALCELIQYAPATPRVHPEPVLIVPAWIMKYYILDLSPHNSLIKHLVDQGHTVFCLSWKNPGVAERDLGMDDYLQHGIHDALAAVSAIVPGRKVHAAGYCLGGTLLAIAAAAMARDGDERLATLSLFAAQTDFAEPGELALFIDESQVSLLEAQMAQTGYLTASQMAGAFQMLRSYDLLWSRIVNEYLLGDRAPMNDLMAWNADATRMPARMHAQYLRQLFLHDDLAHGRYLAGGKPVALSDLTLPAFVVGTLTDHVAPWRSVYKLHYQTVSEITFVLTSGGHNAGIVSPPGHPHRSYQLRCHAAGAPYVSPDAWAAEAPRHEGSWWPAWLQWLQQRSGAPVASPAMGAPRQGYRALGDAPGRYVLQIPS
ncbi:MAG: PHA/PHB synthase family protein [Aquincola tertiaricarbonis]